MSHPKCYVLNCVMCNFGQFVVFLKMYPISMHVSRMIRRIINMELDLFLSKFTAQKYAIK